MISYNEVMRLQLPVLSWGPATQPPGAAQHLQPSMSSRSHPLQVDTAARPQLQHLGQARRRPAGLLRFANPT